MTLSKNATSSLQMNLIHSLPLMARCDFTSAIDLYCVHGYKNCREIVMNAHLAVQCRDLHLRSFLFAPISTERGNRGLPELISLMNTQSFVERHTAGLAVGGLRIKAQYL